MKNILDVWDSILDRSHKFVFPPEKPMPRPHGEYWVFFNGAELQYFIDNNPLEDEEGYYDLYLVNKPDVRVVVYRIYWEINF